MKKRKIVMALALWMACFFAGGALAESPLLDGSRETGWASTLASRPDVPCSFTLQWERPQTLGGLRILPMADGKAFPQSMKITYSYDEAGTYFFPLPECFLPGPDQQVGDNVFLARRIRLEIPRLAALEKGGYGVRIGEVECLPAKTRLPFAIPGQGDMAAQLNMMWNMFGSMTDGTEAVYAFGNEPSYHSWMARKYLWSTTTKGHKETLLKERLLTWPQSEDGYLWSWANQEEWPTADGSFHLDNNPKYIIAAWLCWVWSGADALFDWTDEDQVTEPAQPSRPDISLGKTLREKIRLAMTFLDGPLHGAERDLLLADLRLDPDGSTNDGTVTGDPSNYWDNLRYGHLDAYMNAYYIAALEAMAEMEAHWGEKERAEALRQRREKAIAAYDATFWRPEKNRYIACIDVNGKKWDFGFTFQNLEALTLGAGNAKKARAIFDWLDGGRILEEETSTGADIYHYAWAPRANTIAIETVGPPYWWESIHGAIAVDHASGQWDNHLENGGAIFYTSFYDLMARLKYLGPNNALQRLEVIVAEFRKDQLRRDPTRPGSGPWQFGIIGEFPESGLVPAFVAYGFGGLRADRQGLHIEPQLPATWTELTIRDVNWGGARLDLTLSREDVLVSSAQDSQATVKVQGRQLAPGMSLRAERNGGSDILVHK